MNVKETTLPSPYHIASSMAIAFNNTEYVVIATAIFGSREAITPLYASCVEVTARAQADFDIAWTMAMEGDWCALVSIVQRNKAHGHTLT